MAEVKWIKMSTEIFDNRKIRQIECLPNGDGIIVIWVKLLCLAGSINDNGMVYFTKDIPYTDQMLASQFNRPLALVQLALQTFQQFGMIDITNNILLVSNWEKYQNVDRLNEIREYNRIAQQKSREKKKQLLIANDVNDMSMTSQRCHDTDIDKDIDKDIDNNNNNKEQKEDFAKEFLELWNIYPNKKGKENAKKAYIRARKQGTTYEEVQNGINAYLNEIRIKKTSIQYVKYGSTWFNQKAWEDSYENNEVVAASSGITCFDV